MCGCRGISRDSGQDHRQDTGKAGNQMSGTAKREVGGQKSNPLGVSSELSVGRTKELGAGRSAQARYIMIGGFLGAGKTTSVARLTQWLVDQGMRGGIRL